MKSKTFAHGIAVMSITGFTALLYQVLWMRAFSGIIGGNLISISCVIAHFMLGLGLGNAFAPRLLQRRLKNALPLYSICEALIAILAGVSFAVLFFKSEWPLSLLAVMELPRLLEHFIVTGIFVFPITLLMGFSFPLISYLFPHSKDHQWLYAANCLGGALGAFVSYSVLIYYLGLYNTWLVSLGGNLLAAIIFLPKKFTLASSEIEVKPEPVLSRDFSHIFAIVLSASSGFFILSFEQVWFRLANIILGTKIYVSSLVLTAVLICLGVSALISPRFSKKSTESQIKILILSLFLAMASGVIGLLFMPEAFTKSINLIVPSKRSLSFEVFAVLFFTAFLPSLILGYSFPLAFSLIQKNSKTAWQKTSALSQALYVNTAMSVLGSLLTTYFLFKIFGTIGTLKLLYVLIALIGVVAGFVFLPKQKAITGFLGFAILTGAVVLLKPTLDPLKLSVYNEEDEYGYLSISRLQDDEHWTLYHNYTNLVGSYGHAETRAVQKNLALFGVLLSPHIDDVLVIGMGYGLTTEAFQQVPDVRKITTIELLPGVIRAQEHFPFKDNSYLKDPRVENIADDGRSYLFQADKKWDIINVNVDPYSNGATNLYSVEFYQEVLRKLKPGGIYTQLFYGSNRDLPHMIETVEKSFPYVKLMPGYDYDGLILVASNEPFKKWDSPEISANYERAKNLLPSMSVEGMILKEPHDFSVAEDMGRELVQGYKNRPGFLIRDANLQIERSRIYFWDQFLHYPADYY